MHFRRMCRVRLLIATEVADYHSIPTKETPAVMTGKLSASNTTHRLRNAFLHENEQKVVYFIKKKQRYMYLSKAPIINENNVQ